MFEDRDYKKLDGIILMQKAAQRYVERGVRPGDCLQAILSNNLMMAFACADPDTTALMADICKWMYNDIPSMAHGSKEKVEAWIEAGGVRGHVQAKKERDHARKN